MNKYKTLKNWRIVTKLSATFLLGAILISSCKKEESTVGSSINPNGLEVITSDTFSVKTYSSELDSLETDETSVSLLGAYNDPEFGLVDCGVVTQIRLSSEGPNFGDVNDITVDSVVVPALAFVILVTDCPTVTLSAVLLSVKPCAALGLEPELFSPNVIVLLLNPLGAAILGL